MFNLKRKTSYLIFLFSIALISLPLHSARPVSNQFGELKNLSGPLVADEEGKLILAYVSGSSALPQGSILRIQLPAGWYNIHGCPRVDDILKYQDKETSDPGYFGVIKAPPDIELKTRHWNREDIEGVSNRFVQVFGFELTSGELKPGERMEMMFQARVKDGKPYTPVTGGSGPILSEVILPGEIEGQALPVLPLEVNAGPPNEIWLALPTVSEVGEKIPLKISLVDKHYNQCRNWTGKIQLQKSEGFSGLPDFIEFGGGNRGHLLIEIQSGKPGTYFIQAQAPGIGKGKSNPVLISENADRKIFWGDIHSHSQWSHDGIGTEPFAYARDTAGLDFYANTEHVRALTQDEWNTIQEDTEKYNQPGGFVTILAFENSTWGPSGHHNIYFPGGEAPLTVTGDLAESHERFRELNPLMVQHHSGIGWVLGISLPRIFYEAFNRALPTAASWDEYRDVPRQGVEIYSLHGSSEFYDPEDPLAYEQCDLSLPHGKPVGPCNTGISMDGAHYARDAWAKGLMLGVVGGSDDHRAQPGKPGGSLTAVMAAELTRESILQAIRDRRTYATTGDRIYLSFSISGDYKDSVVYTHGPPEISIHAIGTDSISLIQVMRWDIRSGVWQVAIEEKPYLQEVSINRKDEGFSGEAIYYLRLEQADLSHARPVRAWSSPVWVNTE